MARENFLEELRLIYDHVGCMVNGVSQMGRKISKIVEWTALYKYEGQWIRLWRVFSVFSKTDIPWNHFILSSMEHKY